MTLSDLIVAAVLVFIAMALMSVAMALLSIRKLLARQLEISLRTHTQQALQPPPEISSLITHLLSQWPNRTPDLFEPERLPGTLALLNYLEGIALGVREGIYDEALVRQAFGDTLTILFRILREPIYERRSRHESQLYVALEALVRRWEKEPFTYDVERGLRL